jgi:hypothetical protein
MEKPRHKKLEHFRRLIEYSLRYYSNKGGYWFTPFIDSDIHHVLEYSHTLGKFFGDADFPRTLSIRDFQHDVGGASWGKLLKGLWQGSSPFDRLKLAIKL